MKDYDVIHTVIILIDSCMTIYIVHIRSVVKGGKANFRIAVTCHQLTVSTIQQVTPVEPFV